MVEFFYFWWSWYTFSELLDVQEYVGFCNEDLPLIKLLEQDLKLFFNTILSLSLDIQRTISTLSIIALIGQFSYSQVNSIFCQPQVLCIHKLFLEYPHSFNLLVYISRHDFLYLKCLTQTGIHKHTHTHTCMSMLL